MRSEVLLTPVREILNDPIDILRRRQEYVDRFKLLWFPVRLRYRLDDCCQSVLPL